MAFKDIFTVLDKNKHVPDKDIEEIPSFMFCRYLGNHKFTAHAANVINRYSNIPMLLQYKLIRNNFAGKNIFIKYNKVQPEDKDLEIISKHFKIPLKHAKEYKELLGPKYKEIINMYKELKG